jgi:hypothetical protein
MINQVEYAWENITITAMGRTFERITEIEYGIENDKKHIYGRGSKPRGVQPGRRKPTCSFVIGQSELEAMIREAQKTKPNADITDLTFDIQSHYVLDTDLVKDKIVQFTPSKFNKHLKEGDGEMSIKVEGLPLDILFNQA